MAINKVVYGNQTLIDLTDSTLTSSDELVEGVTAYDRSGNRITGTADYMDKISNPSANKVLIDDGNGQAVDSSLSISDVATQSDLSGKQNTLVSGTNIKTVNNTSLLGSGNVAVQPVLTAGNGIVISGNTIINRFTNLTNVDLNTIRYNCQAYAGDSCTNKPTTNGGMFICTMGSNDGTYGAQLFITYATTNQGVYYRRFNGSATPTEWVKLIKASGDTMTDTLNFENQTGSGVYIKATDLDVTTAPSRNFYGAGIRLRDTNSYDAGIVQPTAFSSSNTIGLSVLGGRRISNTNYQNGVRLLVNSDGTANISLVGTNAANAWRSAIGAQATLVSGTNIKTINNTSLLGSGNLTPANIGAASLYDGQINYPIGNGTNYVAIRRGGSTSSSSAYVGFFTYKNSDNSYINRLETLVNSNGTRNFAVLSDLTYNSGDTFTVPGNYQIFACSIYAPTNYNNVRFFIPTDKPINASTVKCTKLTITLQTAKNAQGAYLINSANVYGVSGYTITCTARGSGIYVDLKCPTTISLTNRDIGTVILGSSTFTFS